MRRRERQQAFAVSVVTVVAAIAAISALGDADDESRSRSTTSPVAAAPPLHTRPPASYTTPRGIDDHPAVSRDATSRRSRAAAKRLTRRFIAAFARYQGGLVDAPTTTELRALATPDLAAYLIAQPPRSHPRAHTRPRIVRLDLIGPTQGRIKAAALLAYGDRRTSLFEVALQRSGRGWRVAELYPSETDR